MEGTLVFVHGTGVRQAGYTATLAAIQGGLRDRLPGVRVTGVDWGVRCGVSKEGIDAALPPQILARDASGALPVTEADQVAARWALERTRRKLAASLALARPGSPARAPIQTQIAATDAELAAQDRHPS